MASIERRLNQLEETVQERNKKPAFSPEDVKRFMLDKGNTGKGNAVDSGVDSGKDSLSSPAFWNQSRMPRWQTRFLEAFGPAIFEDGQWHWPEYRGNQSRLDFTPLP